MSMYENALNVKRELGYVISGLESQVTTQQRDKTGLRWSFGKVGDRSMTFVTDCHAGYYGSSSVSSCNSDAMGREIAETLTELKGEIIARTVARCKRKIADACKLAEEEAKKVLAEVQA